MTENVEANPEARLEALGYGPLKTRPIRTSAMKALYSWSPLEIFAGNRLIAALPDFLAMSRSSIHRRLTQIPEPPPASATRRQRAGWLYALSKKLLIPTVRHVYLQQLIDLVIRQGYIDRDGISPDLHAELQRIYEKGQRGEELTPEEERVNYKAMTGAVRRGSALTLIGVSGIGKTVAIEQALGLMPQVIIHPDDGISGTLTQITYLKVECPIEGSLKTLCLNIINEIDRITGLNYLSHFKLARRSTVESLMLRAAQIMDLHKVGLLVIDEMQNILPYQKGRQDLFNFVVGLSNTINVPILYVGTPRLEPFMKTDMRIARRFGSESCLRWERYKESGDPEWDALLNELWKLSVLTSDKMGQSMPQDIKDCFYQYSAGITDLVVKLFVLSQMRALWCQTEEMTPELMAQVYEDDFKNYHGILNAILQNDKAALERYGDVVFSEHDFSSAFLSHAEKVEKLNLDAPGASSAKASARSVANETIANSGNLLESLRESMGMKQEPPKRKPRSKKAQAPKSGQPPTA